MNETTITPIALIGLTTEKNTCARLLNDDKSIPFDAKTVIGSCVALYEAFLSFVPEKNQNEFEEYFSKHFFVALKKRHAYIDNIETRRLE